MSSKAGSAPIKEYLPESLYLCELSNKNFFVPLIFCKIEMGVNVSPLISCIKQRFIVFMSHNPFSKIKKSSSIRANIITHIEDDSRPWCHLPLKQIKLRFLIQIQNKIRPISYPFNGGNRVSLLSSRHLSQVHSTNSFISGSHLPRLSGKNDNLCTTLAQRFKIILFKNTKGPPIQKGRKTRGATFIS